MLFLVDTPPHQEMRLLCLCSTHIDLDAQRRKGPHGWILLGRVAEELPPSLVPLDAVQTVPLQVVAALQDRVVAPLDGVRDHHHHVPQRMHYSCREKEKGECR